MFTVILRTGYAESLSNGVVSLINPDFDGSPKEALEDLANIFACAFEDEKGDFPEWGDELVVDAFRELVLELCTGTADSSAGTWRLLEGAGWQLDTNPATHTGDVIMITGYAEEVFASIVADPDLIQPGFKRHEWVDIYYFED